jgi:hypothetical protein
VEVTLASGVMSDGSSDPSLALAPLRGRYCGSSCCRRRQGLLQQLLQWSGRPVVVQGMPPAGAQGSNTSQTLPLAEARRKSPAALAPSADVPAPRAGDGATSPSGWTGQSLGDEADAPQDERARKE